MTIYSTHKGFAVFAIFISSVEQMPFFLLVIVEIKVPAIEIAGLCLPLKPQKEILYAELQQIIILLC